MVASGLVDYSAEKGGYALPPEHAAVLSGEVAPNRIAGHVQNIPILLLPILRV